MALAQTTMDTTKYTGRGKSTIEQYIYVHQKAHNKMSAINQPQVKVEQFLAWIVYDKGHIPNLKLHMSWNTTYSSNFDTCQMFIKTKIKLDLGGTQHAHVGDVLKGRGGGRYQQRGRGLGRRTDGNGGRPRSGKRNRTGG
jgi:hypothetical protein